MNENSPHFFDDEVQIETLGKKRGFKKRMDGASVEMLRKKIMTHFGAFSFTSATAAWASPRIAITFHNANQIAGGGQGDIPLELPPPLQVRGSHLRIFFSQRKDEQNQVFYRAWFFYNLPGKTLVGFINRDALRSGCQE